MVGNRLYDGSAVYTTFGDIDSVTLLAKHTTENQYGNIALMPMET